MAHMTNAVMLAYVSCTCQPSPTKLPFGVCATLRGSSPDVSTLGTTSLVHIAHGSSPELREQE
eukprot:1649291-Amphidinium_carterae.1